jgi:hypothetical protein
MQIRAVSSRVCGDRGVARHAQLVEGGQLMSLTRGFGALVMSARVIDRSFDGASVAQHGRYHK